MAHSELWRKMEIAPVGKRRIALRIAAELLETEAFMETCPAPDGPDDLKKMLTRLLHRDRVNTMDGRNLFRQLATDYRSRT